MAITPKTLKLQKQLRDALLKIDDEQIKAMVSAWADAWNEVEPDLTAALLEQLVAGETVTRAQLLRSTRLRKALAAIADHLEALTRNAGLMMIGDLRRVIDNAGGAQASIIDSQLPADADELIDMDLWSRVDARQLAAIVKRSTEQITSLTDPLSDEAYDAVRRELIRGIASGSNPKVTARRMVARAEKGFNGGLARATTIARTEMIDAHRAAAALAQAEQSDVLVGWVWVAELSPRTCPACLAMHGTQFKLSEPGPLGHQNCRCARVPKLKPWKSLGFDIEEPPDGIPDADAFFEALTREQQVAILGNDGWTAWKAGKYPRQAWAERRKTDGWRDSYQTAKAPDVIGRNGFKVVQRPKDVPGEWTGPTAPNPGEVTAATGVNPTLAEKITAFRIASLGHDVHFLPNPSDRKTADMAIGIRTWEIKAPKGSSDTTIRNSLTKAHRQSKLTVLDLYRTTLREDLDDVRAKIDNYWAERTRNGGRRLDRIWVLPENVQDHFTQEYKTWLTQR